MPCLSEGGARLGHRTELERSTDESLGTGRFEGADQPAVGGARVLERLGQGIGRPGYGFGRSGYGLDGQTDLIRETNTDFRF